MEHQQWEKVILSKKVSEKPKEHVEKKKVEDKPIEYFTLQMGQKIASLRASKQLSQEQLAKQMCIPKKTIIDLEQGKEKYNGPLVSKLKKVLGNFSW
jgi:ribosome-binding protein aMBF1 (putative translation factor)